MDASGASCAIMFHERIIRAGGSPLGSDADAPAFAVSPPAVAHAAGHRVKVK